MVGSDDVNDGLDQGLWMHFSARCQSRVCLMRPGVLSVQNCQVQFHENAPVVVYCFLKRLMCMCLLALHWQLRPDIHVTCFELGGQIETIMQV